MAEGGRAAAQSELETLARIEIAEMERENKELQRRENRMLELRADELGLGKVSDDGSFHFCAYFRVWCYISFHHVHITQQTHIMFTGGKTADGSSCSRSA